MVVGGLKSTNLGIACLLADNYAARTTHVLSPLKVTRLNSLDVGISVPTHAPDKVDSVVILNCEGAGEIQVDTNRLLQPEYPSDTLRAFDGELHGKLRYGPGKKSNDYVMNWTSAKDSVTWPVRLNEPATYDVSINYVAEKKSAGGAFTVNFGSQTLSGMVKPGDPQIVALGRVSLKPGTFKIGVAATKIFGGELMRLRSLELKTAAE